MNYSVEHHISRGILRFALSLFVWGILALPSKDLIAVSSNLPLVDGRLDDDRDGLPDSWESLYDKDGEGLEPEANDDHLLSNSVETDLLTNLEEYLAGTRPNISDTDGDGIKDGADPRPITQAFDFGTIHLWFRPLRGIELDMGNGVNTPRDLPRFLESWTDQSSNSVSLLQQTDQSQPRYISSLISGAVNSGNDKGMVETASVNFDGIDDYMTADATVLSGADTDIVIVIAWMPTADHDGVVWTQDGMSLVADSSGYYYFEYSGFHSDAIPYRVEPIDDKNNYHIVTVVELEGLGGVQSKMRLHHNGMLSKENTFDLPVLAPTGTIAIGSAEAGLSSHFSGAIWEIVVLSGGLPEAGEFEHIFSYFRDTYQLNLFAPELPDAPEASIFMTPNPSVDFVYAGDSISATGESSLGVIRAYHWDYENDGVLDHSGATANLIFTASGNYETKLTVEDVFGQVSQATKPFTIRSIPEASFTVSSSVCFISGGSVEFNASSSIGEDLTYAWDFGNGSVGSEAAVSHTYQLAGTYIVTLTVDDGSYPGTVAVSEEVTIIDAPSVDIAVDNSSPGVSEEIQFSTTALWPCPGAEYSWTFGDGQSAEGSSVNHSYAESGSYTVTLTVTLNGLSSVETYELTVVDAVVASFEYEPESEIVVGDTVSFNASSSTGPVATYEWYFGDGSPIVSGPFSTHGNVSHVYAAEGDYTVILTVYDDGTGSDSDTYEQIVSIQSSVFDFGQIKQWVRSEQGLPASGAPVPLWDDQSLSGNDYLQASASEQPTYIENASDGTMPSSHVLFDGSDDFLVSSAVALPADEEMTLILAWRSTSAASSVLWQQGNVIVDVVTGGDGQLTYGISLDGGATRLLERSYSVNESIVSIFTISKKDALNWEASLHHNDFFVNATFGADPSFSNADSAYLGRSAVSPARFYEGEIRELVIVAGTPEEGDITAIVDHLQSEYQLDLDRNGDGLPDNPDGDADYDGVINSLDSGIFDPSHNQSMNLNITSPVEGQIINL